MQFMPRTAERFGLEGEELNDPAKNIEAGVEYLMFLPLLRRFSIPFNCFAVIQLYSVSLGIGKT